jgi:alcohol dehydrogenase class IV
VGVSFVFRTAAQVIFGEGEGLKAPEAALRFGRRPLLVTGGASLEKSGVLPRLVEKLPGVTRVVVRGEPEVEAVDELSRVCREERCDVVLAVGGGSVLDAGKAVAALATHDGLAVDYLEDVPGAGGRSIEKDPLPFVAVPTTAGSGSEVTRNAVLRVALHKVKRSMRSDRMLPRLAIVDPSLAATAPRDVAAAAGLDALTHLIEAYVSKNAQPTTDALALRGIDHAVTGLRAIAGGAFRPEMALASLWGGIALANAGLGAVHGIVAPLGGRCSVPHGAGCGCLLAATTRANVEALRARAPGHPALARYAEIAQRLGTSDLAAALDELRETTGVPRLAAFGATAADVEPVVAQSRGSSMKTNPIDLTDAELEAIVRASL